MLLRASVEKGSEFRHRGRQPSARGGGQPLHWRRPQRAKRAGSGGGGGAGRPAKPGAPLTAKALKTFSCVTGARAAGTGAPAGAAPRGQAAGRGGCRRRGLPQQRTKRAPPRRHPAVPTRPQPIGDGRWRAARGAAQTPARPAPPRPALPARGREPGTRVPATGRARHSPRPPLRHPVCGSDVPAARQWWRWRHVREGRKGLGWVGAWNDAKPRTRKTRGSAAPGLGPLKERTTSPGRPREGGGARLRSRPGRAFKVMVGTGGAARCPAARAGRGGGGDATRRERRARPRPSVNSRPVRLNGRGPVRRGAVALATRYPLVWGRGAGSAARERAGTRRRRRGSGVEGRGGGMWLRSLWQTPGPFCVA